MSVLKFSAAIDEYVRVGLIGVNEMKEALMTALLEVDPDIRRNVIDKVWEEDFGFTLDTLPTTV